jgi:hypothetical protein
MGIARGPQAQARLVVWRRWRWKMPTRACLVSDCTVEEKDVSRMMCPTKGLSRMESTSYSSSTFTTIVIGLLAQPLARFD